MGDVAEKAFPSPAFVIAAADGGEELGSTPVSSVGEKPVLRPLEAGLPRDGQ